MLVTVATAGVCLLLSLTPEEAVERALRVHPLLAAQQARVESAQGLMTQASLKPNPRLFLQSENTRFGDPPHAPFQFNRDTDSFLYASQVFEMAGKRMRRTEAAREVISRRELEKETRGREIARRVLLAYWSAVGAERLRDVLKSSLDNYEQTVQYHRDRVREGALAEADLIRIDLEKEQVAVQYRNATQDAIRARLELQREIADPSLSLAGETLTGTLTVTPDAAAVALIEEAAIREKRADLRLGSQIVEQTKAVVRLETANARPDPEVLFGYKRTSGFNTVIAGVQINLPVRNRNQGNIAAAQAEQRGAEFELQAASQSALNEFRAARGDLEQKMKLLRDEIPRIEERAAETARIARAVYREGASDLLRLLDAERAGLQAELLHIRTLMECRLALVNVQAASGTLP